MSDRIMIQLLGSFDIIINDQSVEHHLSKSKKGLMLLRCLILRDEETLSNAKLYEMIWPNEESSNPESALKTLVSRMRTILTNVSARLGKCIKTERGSYRWNRELDIQVDVFEFENLCAELGSFDELTPTIQEKCRRVLNIYAGDLSYGEEEDWMIGRSINLHNQYVGIVYNYLEVLKAAEDYDEIIHVCRVALEVDAFDERFHLELMNALVKTNRHNEAMLQYKQAVGLHFRYLGVTPPDSIQEFYKQIIQTGRTLDLNVDSIRNELVEYGEVRGAFICEYAVFKEIYSMQMRNLERLGSTMFIGLIMISTLDGEQIDPLKLDDIMRGLLDVLCANLRKGDTVTRFSASQYALLLPTVNYESGAMVMERIKKKYYLRNPNTSTMFNYRIGPLGSQALVEK